RRLRARARLPAMRVLGLETSTLAGGVALVDGERLVAEYVLDVSVTHSERLLAAVDRVLADARWAPRDLEGVAVSIGPGSFTGLRLGVSTATGVDSPHARHLPAPRRVPSPACVAVLGRERLRLGDSVGAAELAPLYLRPSQAELRRRAATLR